MTKNLRAAAEPFQFFTVAHVTRSVEHKASTPRQLLEGLERCSDESIHHHMVDAMGNVEFQPGCMSNDFAKWVHASANCGGLSEQLAALDERYYTSIEEMRNDLWTAVRDYIAAYPECADEAASTPFCFNEGFKLSVPLDLPARTLKDFRTSVQTMTSESFYLHFIASASRLEMQSNDFSIWLTESLGLVELAKKINEIDLAQSTLEAARDRILQLIDAEANQHDSRIGDAAS
jgi:hypothetical protein